MRPLASPQPLGPGLAVALALAVTACNGLLERRPAEPDAVHGGSTPQTDAAAAESPLLQGTHQLTFEGRRSGEGYFSREGSKLVFQSERFPGNPFYQIYLMDLENGGLDLVSPGVGKTTCGWIHPGGQRILFASTHLDPKAREKQEQELAAREEGRERRYAWDYDQHYDLFAVALDDPGEEPRRLTRAHGYDAEASWSPNGRQIVFASNRHAYQEDAPAPGIDAERLAADPSAFVDLYIMDASGRNPRRLTETEGYDGGPFFSPDGGRIVWRRFSPEGDTAEIFSMNTDGSEVRQLTRLGAMSWAPYYHPSGEYVVFTTNLHGFDDFELYIVDIEGTHEPVRVSHTPGFDGLPVFAPGGDELVWTSTRGTEKTSQLHRASWDDALARSLLDLPPLPSTHVESLLPLPDSTRPEISQADLRAHVAALSSDVTEGRLSGTAGERIATSYVARAFRAAGVPPADEEGSYFQTFGFTAGVSLGADNRLELLTSGGPAPGPRTFEVGVDWRPFAFSRTGEQAASEVVYAGYGIVAPEGEGQRAIDSYADLDVEDRWVLVFRFVPAGLSPESRQHLHAFSSLRYKAMVARDRGARGLLVVSGPNSKVREQLAPLRFDVSLAGSSITALSITDAAAEVLLASSGRSLGALQDEADASSATRGFVLEDVRVAARVELVQQRREARNVLARVQAGAEPSREVVVIGAHVDHLGHGEGASSLARADEKGAIHPGADDNASGVAALLEIAQHLASLRSRGELDTKRDIVFAAWSGEELGLLGSSHFVGEAVNPHLPDAKLSDTVVAYLNMDMVGRKQEKVALFGVVSSSIWPREIERENVLVRLPITLQQDAYLPTDATAFYMKEVPVLSAFTGAHAEYHTPRDTPEKLDFAGLAQIAELMGGITASLARRSERPDYVATSMPARARAGARMRVYLGTIPDYAQSDLEGVLLGGVGKDGPAEKAGVRAGDIVIELAGRAVENIYDYTFALEALAVDEPTTIVVLRDGKRLQLEIVPGSRQ